MSFIPNRNPRFDRHFAVTIYFENYTLGGRAVTPSSFGASVEISGHAFEHLNGNSDLWKDKQVKVSTAINDLPGSVGSLFSKEDRFYMSLKLLDGRSWYE